MGLLDSANGLAAKYCQRESKAPAITHDKHCETEEMSLTFVKAAGAIAEMMESRAL